MSSLLVNYSQLPPTDSFLGYPIDTSPKKLNNLLPNFQWDNVILAGGSVLSTLINNDVRDLDFWIFGSLDEVKKTFTRCYGYFKHKFNRIQYNVYPSYIELTPENSTFPSIQLLYAGDKDEDNYTNLLKNFDLDPCRCLYDGTNIYGTQCQLNSLMTGVISEPIAYGDVKYSRLAKYTRKGFSITRKYAKWLHLVPACEYPSNAWYSQNYICSVDPWHGCIHIEQWNQPYKLTEEELTQLSSCVRVKEDFHTQCKICTTLSWKDAIIKFPFIKVDENDFYKYIELDYIKLDTHPEFRCSYISTQYRNTNTFCLEKETVLQDNNLNEITEFI